MTVGILSTLLTLVLILFPLYQFEILRIPRFLPLPILALMTLAAVANVAMIGVLGIFITHRLAGPMYSLVKHFRLIEEGCWVSNIRLREGDDMRYVVRNFNGMMASIKQRTQSDLEQLKMMQSLSNEENLESSEKLERISNLICELEAEVSSRLSSPSMNTMVK